MVTGGWGRQSTVHPSKSAASSDSDSAGAPPPCSAEMGFQRFVSKWNIFISPTLSVYNPLIRRLCRHLPHGGGRSDSGGSWISPPLLSFTPSCCGSKTSVPTLMEIFFRTNIGKSGCFTNLNPTKFHFVGTGRMDTYGAKTEASRRS